ncbi:MAG: STAS/SEC14 domain-containing protein [Candidatus Methylumidiphilus sp.]
MTATLTHQGNIATITVQGQLLKHDYDQMLRESGRIIAEVGRVKLLIVGKSFAGFEKARGWGDLSFMMEHDEDVVKIAIVAELRWRDELLMFFSAGMRVAEVKFYTPEQQGWAEAWLAED